MRFALPLACLALPLVASPAAAQVERKSAVPRAITQAAVIFPLTIVTKSNMDFGYVSVIGAGTAVIDPNSGALSVTGGVTALGGTPRPATFVGAARSAAVVNIRVPNQPITITRVGGTETMQVRGFTLQGQDKRTLARLESFEFNVGATLALNAGQAEGLYTGSFDVTVQYP